MGEQRITSGPLAGRAGYDAMIQGMGGIMSITGEAGGYLRVLKSYAHTRQVLEELLKMNPTDINELVHESGG